MEAIRIEILNSKAMKLLEGMEDLKLIKVTKEITENTDELPQWQKEIIDNRQSRINNSANYIPIEDFIKELDRGE